MVYWLTINGAQLHQGMNSADAEEFARECVELGATVTAQITAPITAPIISA